MPLRTFPTFADHVALCERGWVLQRSHAYSGTLVHDAIGALLVCDMLSVDSPVSALVRQALPSGRLGPAPEPVNAQG